MKILVVDDDEASLEYAKAVLVRTGHSVETASNGDEAFRLYREHRPFDLVLTDLEHPGLSGMELIAAIHRINPQPYAFLTGHPILRKPFKPQELLDLVDQADPRSARWSSLLDPNRHPHLKDSS